MFQTNTFVEVHPNWEAIVDMSYSAGLGDKDVVNLNEHLFPCEDFPNKYDRYGRYLG
jgi:hypothetical protein